MPTFARTSVSVSVTVILATFQIAGNTYIHTYYIHMYVHIHIYILSYIHIHICTYISFSCENKAV